MRPSVLVRWDLRRAWKAVAHAGPGTCLAGTAAVVLGAGLLRAVPPPHVGDVGGAARWGFLVSALIGFFAYGVLLRPGDAWLLRRTGVSGTAIFARQAVRLFALAMAASVAAAVSLLGREAVSRPLGLTVAASMAAAGSAALVYAGAAHSLAVGSGGRGLLTRLVGWDRELAAAAPLVYAPLVPLISGILAATWVGSTPGPEWIRVVAVGVFSLAAILFASRPYARLLARWMPLLSEMAVAPPPDGGGETMVVGRGVARLLPRPAAAVWARDAAVVARRFRWAGRLAWPVAGVGVIALARAGDEAAVRGWVVTLAVLAVFAQLGAVVAIGKGERAAGRWLDRSLGLVPAHRWLGRWALGIGLTGWLVGPLALAWGLAVPGASGWPWVLAAAIAAAVASLASVGLAR